MISVVGQQYEVDVFKTTVMLNNDALVRCEIPSHVGDMVAVIGWVDSSGDQIQFSSLAGNNTPSLGNLDIN